MADVEASDNENYDNTLKIIPQQITAEKRVLQNNPSHEQFFEADRNENINTPIQPNVQDMYFNPHRNTASTSTSSVTVTPKRSFATVFNDVIPWPHLHDHLLWEKEKRNIRPALLHLNDGKEKKEGTSEKQWEKTSSFKTQEKKAPLSSENEDEEEWIESGDSLDDIVINEVTDQETDDIIFQVEDLNVGDYILALFVSTGKRAVVHYKAVFKKLDETKTAFKFIENDQCVIAKKEIFGRLLDPPLVQFGRILKTVFPAEVEVYKKS
ncbi:hypothetical protein FQA39_LY05529 [Lamprigera yunnana]|nr:hypothetical protein FQA39_LY05529 [Lamprigera yunnana]